jgi:hypothetical protein
MASGPSAPSTIGMEHTVVPTGITRSVSGP